MNTCSKNINHNKTTKLVFFFQGEIYFSLIYSEHQNASFLDFLTLFCFYHLFLHKI